jgi:hypothetical protein
MVAAVAILTGGDTSTGKLVALNCWWLVVMVANFDGGSVDDLPSFLLSFLSSFFF